MKIFPQLLNKTTTLLVSCTLCLGMASTAMAVPITGDALAANPGWTPSSTNALNYAQQTPGHIGQETPYVLFDSSVAGSVTLDFFNFGPGLAFFETRIDGIETGATAHPVVAGDTIHSGGTSVASGTSLLDKIFMANSYVDIRLALGGESDFRFGWTRFEVAPSAEVPEPAILGLFALSLLGIAATRRRAS